MNSDVFYMRKAIAEGEKARCHAPPNPWVGCILVKNQQIIATGHTQQPGQPHAEVMALQQAGGNAKGSTAFITLEPCSHYGRTPPCAKALIEAGVDRVVIGVQDPDSRVSGAGAAMLRQAGIEAMTGICSEEVEFSLRSYLHQRRTGQAYCLLKTAVSIDGRIAAKDRTSQWITSKEARADAHSLRSISQAILVGSGTVLADNPSLTVRLIPPQAPPPLRVLLDRQGRIPAEGALFDVSLAPTLVVTSQRSLPRRREEWTRKGAEVFILEEEAPFEKVLSYLGSKGIIQVMVEGGATLHSSLIRDGLCREMVVYIGPIFLGDQGLPAFTGLDIPSIVEAPALTLIGVKTVGQTIRCNYLINQGKR